jgi:hypothetical protein
VSQSLVSHLERGHVERMAFATIRSIAAALDARVGLDVRWRGGELERLIDADHAALTSVIARRLASLGWDVRVEVTYADLRASGSIDVLAWHAATRSLLVIEVKTEITSGELVARRLDEKARIASGVATTRFGWRAATVSRLLIVEASKTARRRVESGGGLFDAALPARGTAVRAWLRRPAGTLAGLLFVSLMNQGGGIAKLGARHRVRKPRRTPDRPGVSVKSSDTAPEAGADGPRVLTNWR